jgi:serine/threonine-protein kinase
MTIERLIGGKYRVLRRIGAGGMGEVLLALHEDLEQNVAIKLLRADRARDTLAVERFLREARAMARIQNDHVVRVFDVGRDDDGTPFIVMEFLQGEDLSVRLAATGAMPVNEAVDYVLQACVAIAEAHRVGVVHRDLKPGNLFLARRPGGGSIVKVVDFGISKLAPRGSRPEASLTTTSHLVGSPFYMSPEQLRGTGEVDARSDIWSLGLILFELLTNEGPFDAPTIPQLCMAIMDNPPKLATQLRPEIPAALDGVILRALAKDPAARYRDVAELAGALAPFAISGEDIAKATRQTLSRPPMPEMGDWAEGADSGEARETTDAWNTGNVATQPRRVARIAVIAAAVVALVAAVSVTMRLTSSNPSASTSATMAPSGSIATSASTAPVSASTATIAAAPVSASNVTAQADAAAPSATAKTLASARPTSTVAKPPPKASAAPVSTPPPDEFGGRK